MSIFPIAAKVTGDVGGFVSAMGAASSSLGGFASAAGLAGGAIGALAGAAAMGAAIKAATEFEAELTKLNTLVGVQAEQIDEWSGAMRRLARETGNAPADLARAMFAITSGGAQGAQALEILEQSAKASSVGLGDMTAIGRTATAALQAFGSQGLTATEAIDIMLATVRAGNLEAESLAGSLGRVMGVAAAMGVTFEEVGSFIATYTRLGVSAEQATTGLQAALTLLLKPGEEQRQVMEELGISIEDMREKIRSDGLTSALIEMREAIGDNVDALGAVVPNVRALASILGTAGVQAESFKQTTEDITNSMGLVNDGFAIWSGTSEATIKKFNASAKDLAISVGDVLLPPLRLILQLLTPLVDLVGLVARGIGELIDVMIGVPWRSFVAGFRDFMDVATPVDQVNEKVVRYIENLKNLSDVDLAEDQKAMADHLESLQARIAETGDKTGRLTQARDEALVMLRALNEETQRRQVVIEDANVAQEEENQLTAEAIDLAQRRYESIDRVLTALENETLALQESKRAVLEKQLVEMGALETTIQYALGLYDTAEALRAAQQAERDAAREAENIARQREREMERAEERRRQVVERAAENAQRAADREALATIQEEMRRAGEVAEAMSEAMADAFEAIVSGTKNVGDAFADMVTVILRELARLAVERSIVEPLFNFLMGAIGPGRGSSLSVSEGQDLLDFANSFGPSPYKQQVSAPNTGMMTGESLGMVGNAVVQSTQNQQQQSGLGQPLGGFPGEPQKQVVVHQNITFAPQMIDGRDSVRFLRENQGEIMEIVGEGALRSTQFQQMLVGQER